MSKQTEALKLALEALENTSPLGFNMESDKKFFAAITAIREALAEQPAQQQEPVAWMWRCKPYCDWPEWSVSLKRPADSGRDGHKRTEGYEDVPLYTSPPASKPWVGLTDVEWMNIVNKDHAWFGQRPEDVAHEVAKLVEAKLREKNA